MQGNGGARVSGAKWRSSCFSRQAAFLQDGVLARRRSHQTAILPSGAKRRRKEAEIPRHYLSVERTQT